jgi:membrane-associated phospholipid phosphatase
MLAVWFSFLPACIAGASVKAAKWAKIIFKAAILFGVAVMFSRLILGKHFLSDVACGAALSLAMIAIFKTLVESNYGKIRKLCFSGSSW